MYALARSVIEVPTSIVSVYKFTRARARKLTRIASLSDRRERARAVEWEEGFPSGMRI